MRIVIVLIAAVVQLFVLSGCPDDGRHPHNGQASDKLLRQQQVAAIETGFAFGTATSRVVLPPELRGRSFSGIDYDSTDLARTLNILGIPDENAKAIIAAREAALGPDLNHLQGGDKLSAALLKIRQILEAGGNILLDKAVRIGFSVGDGCETASITLSMKPDDSQAAKAADVMRLSWSPFKQDVAVANLPQEMKAKLVQLNLDFKTVQELRDFRDKCFDFWSMVHGSVKSPNNAEWIEHKHPRGFTFRYPPGWTVQDSQDTQTYSVMLFPPGVSLESHGPDSIFVLMRAVRGVSDPRALKAYYENELHGLDIVKYAEHEFKVKNVSDQGTILAWDIRVPPKNAPGGFTAYVFLINGWAVQMDVFAPTETTKKFDTVLRQIAESVVWKP